MKTQKITQRLATFYLFMTFFSLNAQEAFFEGIGFLYENPNAPEFTYSNASAVTDNGKVVGYSSSSVINNGNEEQIDEAFLWEDGNLQPLGALGDPTFPPNYWSIARDISDDGSVIVGYSFSENVNEFDPFPAEAMRWTSTGGMEGIGGLSPEGYQSEANAVSADGSVIVGTSNFNIEAFRWENGEMTSIAEGIMAEALDVTADGNTIVGTAVFPEGQQAFIWTEDTGMVGIGAPDEGSSVARNVSADGNYVVGYEDAPDTPSIAFRWTEDEGRVSIGDLPGGEATSQPTAVSNNGTVIVGTSHSQNGWEAFIWREGQGMQPVKEVLENEYNLDLANWYLTSTTDISGDGNYIVGNGINPEGIGEAWVAYIPNLMDINQYNEVALKLYPNPTTGIINIKTEQPITQAEVYTLTGSKLPAQLSETGNTIDISDLLAGIYFVRITVNNHSQTYKVIKQ